MDISFITPFFFFTALCCGMAAAFRRPFGECMPIALTGPVFLLCYSQYVFHTFRAGFWAAVVMALAGAAFTVHGILRRREGVLPFILSSGLLAFALMYVLFAYIDYKRPFTTWDEMNHWGKMVKEMLRLDRFYSDPASQLLKHKEYPPFISVYQSLWCALGGAYSEGTVTLATHVFSFSMFFPPIMENVRMGQRWIRPVKTVCILMACLLTVLFLDPYHIFMTVYMDVCVGLVFAYCMYMIHAGRHMCDNFSAVSISLMLAALMQVKQIGMAFFLVCMLYAIMTALLPSGGGQAGIKERVMHRGTLRAVLAFLFPCLNQLVWTGQVKRLGIVGQFDMSHISFGEIAGIASGSIEGLRHETFVNFLRQLAVRNLTSGVPVSISFVLGVLILLAAVLALHLRHRGAFDRKGAAALGASLLLGAVGYAAVMSVLYMFCFEENEMRNFGSFSRYMASYLVGGAVLLFLIYSDVRKRERGRSPDGQEEAYKGARKSAARRAAGRHKRRVRNYEDVLLESGAIEAAGFIIMALLLAASTSANLQYLVPQREKGDPIAYFRELSDGLMASTEPGSTVYLVAEGYGNDSYQVFISYLADDRLIRYNRWDTLFPLSYDYGADPGKRDVILEEMRASDYVYVIDTNENFNGHFSDLTGGGPFEARRVYRVSDENGALVLR